MSLKHNVNIKKEHRKTNTNYNKITRLNYEFNKFVYAEKFNWKIPLYRLLFHLKIEIYNF